MIDLPTLGIAVAALALGSLGGWPVTAWVLRRAVPAEPVPEPHDADDPEPTPAVLRGGTWIGVLERLAVTGTLLAGYPAGIALVVAVKGLGRYPELLKHPGASEKFVIGTLTSMLWAAAVGAGLRLLLV